MAFDTLKASRELRAARFGEAQADAIIAGGPRVAQRRLPSIVPPPTTSSPAGGVGAVEDDRLPRRNRAQRALAGEREALAVEHGHPRRGERALVAHAGQQAVRETHPERGRS